MKSVKIFLMLALIACGCKKPIDDETFDVDQMAYFEEEFNQHLMEEPLKSPQEIVDLGPDVPLEGE